MGEAVRVDISSPAPAGALSPESVQKLTEQARNGVTQAKTGEGESRPAWLPEKFKSPEDMAKAYSELEKKQGSAANKPAEPAKPTTGEPVKGTEGLKIETTPEQKTAEAAVTGAGLKMDELNAEYQAKGELSAESLKKLDGAGINKQMVDAFIEGQKAIAAARLSDLHGVAGGAEQFAEMHRWSADNLSEPEKATLNKVIEAGDHAAIKLAFEGIHGKWSAAGQNEPMRQVGGSKAAGESGGYAHRDEILADMKTQKYKTSQAERDRVLSKIRQSAKGVW